VIARRVAGWIVAAAWLAGCAGTVSADTLTVRLVEAGNSGTGTSPALADVARLLKENMPFSSYVLVDSRQASVPGKGAVEIKGGYRVQYSGGGGGLTVVIQRDGKDLLRSTVALTASSPVVVGGFPSEKGKSVFVFTLVPEKASSDGSRAPPRGRRPWLHPFSP
jgi:hypothetical protein